MDSSSVVGLIVSVQGLLRNVLQSITEYEGHVKEFETLSAQLDTQRAVFTNEVRALLSIVSDTQEDFNNMVNDPAHVLWEARTLDERLRNVFGESFGTWTSRLRSIKGIMCNVYDETQKFKNRLNSRVSPQVVFLF